MMVKCCFDECLDESRWIRIIDGRVVRYYYDGHMTYLALDEDTLERIGKQ